MYPEDLFLVFGIVSLMVADADSFYYLILRNIVTLECMVG